MNLSPGLFLATLTPPISALLEKPSPYDSTLHKTPKEKPSRLPAYVVEPRSNVAGNTRNNKNLALAVRCIGLVVNMTSGRTIRAEPGEKYPYLNRDGVGMPEEREASGPLEARLWDGLGQARLVV